MKIGYSLSPGGLLLPYHLGALQALKYHGRLDESNPLTGASAGSIAVTSCAGDVNLLQVLDATVDISDRCKEEGGVWGRLMPLLKEKLDQFIGHDEFRRVAQREGKIAIAYREVFPTNTAIHQKEFTDRQDLMDAVCHSSMFPFFTSYMPTNIDFSSSSPRLLVDGFFSVPLHRFGCPDFNDAGIQVDRTIAISVFPRELSGLNLMRRSNVISPPLKSAAQLAKLAFMACQSSSAHEMHQLYESGWSDAELWCMEESNRERNSDSMELIFGLQPYN